MASSSAKSVREYLKELPSDRRKDVEHLLKLARASLKPGFKEEMAWGMICFSVPLEISGPTYNDKPLVYLGIASQVRHISVYASGLYASKKITEQFNRRWLKSGKRLDMGKGCIRFKNADSVDSQTLEWLIGLQTPAEFAEIYTKARAKARS